MYITKKIISLFTIAVRKFLVFVHNCVLFTHNWFWTIILKKSVTAMVLVFIYALFDIIIKPQS